jgi:DNA mismatch repair ATPase MutS
MTIIFTQGKVVKEVTANAHSKVGELIKLASPQTIGLNDNLEDQEVYVLDEKEELSKDAILDQGSLKDQRAFVIHRCKKVQVTVLYAGKTYTHSYPPSKKLQHIRHDAINKLEIDGPSSQNLELFEKSDDQNSKVNRAYPVGYLTEYPTCSITLHLADPNAFAG